MAVRCSVQYKYKFSRFSFFYLFVLFGEEVFLFCCFAGQLLLLEAFLLWRRSVEFFFNCMST